MNDRNFNGPRGIKEWESVESIALEEQTFRSDGKEIKMGAHLEVKRPVFHDGNRGRPVLELTLQKDRWSFRFRIPREGDNEAEKAVEVIQAVLAWKEKGYEAYDRISKAHEAEREEERTKRIVEHEKFVAAASAGRGDSKANKGLGQYSQPGKTKRHRDRGKESRDSR